MHQITRVFTVMTAATLLTAGMGLAADRTVHSSNMFAGSKANTGKVNHYYEGSQSMLSVSDEFRVPDTPAPTWRIVDTSGAIYTLDAFKIKGGEKRQIKIPAYAKDIAKVQVYCAWAEVLLGEASFPSPVR